MSPDSLFQLANPVALLGWIALALSPLAPVWADRIAATVIPLILSVAYTALILTWWSTGSGGFRSLPEVMALFTTPGKALAGWVHYLAFDLFIGAWIARTARATGIAHWVVLPCLVLTFLFGPIGLLAFLSIRAVTGTRQTM
jgi:Domain of unknown function (DUF4281)